MAVTIGTDYNHIDMKVQGSSNVTRHMLQDTKARDDVDNIKSAIVNKADVLSLTAIAGNEQIVFTDGYRVNTTNEPITVPGSLNSYAGYGYAIIDCMAGEKFFIDIYGGDAYKPYTFINNAGAIIERPTGYQYHGVYITTPSGATKLVLNGSKSRPRMCVRCPSDANLPDAVKGKLLKDAVAEIAQQVEDASGESTQLEETTTLIVNGVELATGNDIISLNTGYITTSGKYTDITQPTSSNRNYRYAVIECAPGDTFTVKGLGGSDPRLYAFITTTGEDVARETSSHRADATELQATGKVITAPQGVDCLVVNFNVGSNSEYGVVRGAALRNVVDLNKANVEWTTGNETIDIPNIGYIGTSGNTCTIGAPTSNRNYKYAVIDCQPGDKFTITGTGGSTPLLWAFAGADSNGTRPVLSPKMYGTVAVDAVITAPSSAEKLIVNVQVAHEYALCKGIAIKKVNDKINGLLDLETLNVTSTDGKYVSYNNNLQNDSNSCYTNYVPVFPGRTIKISGLYADGNRAICGYAADQSYNADPGRIIDHYTESDYSFVVPDGIYFIRASGHAGVTPVIKQSLPSLSDIQHLYNAYVIPLRTPYNISKNKKIVTLIDDDLQNDTAVGNYADMFDDMSADRGVNLKCTFAAIAKMLDANNPDYASTAAAHIAFAKDLQSRGFHIANHTYDHSRWYGDSAQGNMFTLEECDQDLIKSIEIFDSLGFIDSGRYLVYTGSSGTRAGIPEVAKKWCECAATIVTGNNTLNNSSRFQLNRCYIDATWHDTLAWYQAQLQELETDSDNWIIYYTHCKDGPTSWGGNASGKFDPDLVKAVLENALDNGYTMMTYREAWNYRKAQYMMQEAFGF